MTENQKYTQAIFEYGLNVGKKEAELKDKYQDAIFTRPLATYLTISFDTNYDTIMARTNKELPNEINDFLINSFKESFEPYFESTHLIISELLKPNIQLWKIYFNSGVTLNKKSPNLNQKLLLLNLILMKMVNHIQNIKRIVIHIQIYS